MAVRNVRRDVLKKVDKMDLPEDDLKGTQDDVQVSRFPYSFPGLSSSPKFNVWYQTPLPSRGALAPNPYQLLQSLTDEYIEKIDKMVATKNTELTTV